MNEELIKKLDELMNDDKFIFNICLSYRNDYGLLSPEEQKTLRFEAKEWMRSLINNLRYA